MAQFDPVVIPVNADTEQLERAFKKVAKDADKTAKSVQKSFEDAFKNVGKAAGTAGKAAAGSGVAAQVARNSGGLLQKVGGPVGKGIGAYFGILDIQDAFKNLTTVGRYLATPTTQLKNFAKAAVESSAQVVTGLGQIALAFQGLQSVIGLATGALTSFFNSTVGREIEFRRTVLNIQSTIASTSRVFDKNGDEITKPLEKIRSLEKPVRSAIQNIIKESEKISGTTSSEIIGLFQIITTYSGQAKLSLKQAEQLSLKFAAGLGTLGIPGYQAQQEIGSILSGQITDDSALAKKLQITPQQVSQAQQAGKLYELLTQKLETVVAGQEEASKGFDGLTSNIQEIKENVEQAFGKPLLDPLIAGLNKIFDILTGTKDQFKATADAAGQLVAQFSTNIIGSGFKGLEAFAKNLQTSLSANGSREVAGDFVRSIQEAGASIGRSLESTLLKASEKLDGLLASFGKLVVVLAQLRFEKFAISIQTLASTTELYLNTIFRVQEVLLNLKASIIQALGPLGQFLAAFKAVDQVLGPATQGITSFLFTILPLAKSLNEVRKALLLSIDLFRKFGDAAKVVAEIEKIQGSLKNAQQASVAFSATLGAVNLLTQAGGILGKTFSALLPLFGALGKAAVFLGKQFFTLQLINIGLEAAITLVVLAWQKYGDTQKELQQLAEDRIQSETKIKDAIQGTTGALRERRLEEEIQERRRQQDNIAQGLKESQDLISELRNKPKDLFGNELINERQRLAAGLAGTDPLGLSGDKGDRQFASAVRQFIDKDPQARKELEQILKDNKFAPGAREEQTLAFVDKFLGTPDKVEKLNAALKRFFDEQEKEIADAERRKEAERVESAAATSLQRFANVLRGRASATAQGLSEIVGDFQSKLANTPAGTKQFEEIAARIKAAQLIAEEASKTALDRAKEEAQVRQEIARKRLDSELEVKSIRRQAQEVERKGLLANVSEQAQKYLDLYNDRRTREEEIQDNIKRAAQEIAIIQQKAWENQVDKALVVKSIIETIKYPELNAQVTATASGATPAGRTKGDINFLAYNSVLENLGNPDAILGTAIVSINRALKNNQSFKGVVTSPGQYAPLEAITAGAQNQGQKGNFFAALESGDSRKIADYFKRYAGPRERDRLRNITPAQLEAGVQKLLADLNNPQKLEEVLGKLGQAYYQNPGSDITRNRTFRQQDYGSEVFYIDPRQRKTTPAQVQQLVQSRNSGQDTNDQSAGLSVQITSLQNQQGLKDAQEYLKTLRPALGSLTGKFDRENALLAQDAANLQARIDASRELLRTIQQNDPVNEALTADLKRLDDQTQIATEIKRLDEQLLKKLETPGLTQKQIDDLRDDTEVRKRIFQTFRFPVLKLAEARDIFVKQLARTDLSPAAREALTRERVAANRAIEQFNLKQPEYTAGIRKQVTAEREGERTNQRVQAAIEASQAEFELTGARSRLGQYNKTTFQLEAEELKRAFDPAAQDKVRTSIARFWTTVTTSLAEEERRAADEYIIERDLLSNPDIKPNVAFATAAVVRRAGAAQYSSLPRDRQQELVDAEANRQDTETRTELGRSLREKRNQLELDRERLKLLTASNTEQRIQAQIELRILELKQQGKTLLPEERQKLEVLLRDNAELDKQRRLLEALSGQFEQTFTGAFDGIANEIAILFGKTRQEGENLFTALQQLASDFFLNIGRALQQDLIKDLSAFFTRNVKEGVQNIFSALFGGSQQGGEAAPVAAAISQAASAASSAFDTGQQYGPFLPSVPATAPSRGVPTAPFPGASLPGVDAIAQAFGLGTNSDNSLPGAAANLNKAAQALLTLAGLGSPISGGGGGITNLLGGLGGLFGGGSSAVASLAAPASTGILDLVSVFAANGGVMRGGFRAFASGGIVSQPTLGLVGEGRFNEAVVPLPDGKSIPVMMRSSSSARDYMQGQSAASPVLNMQFETVQIMGEEYVSRSQLEEAMAQTRRQAAADGARNGMSMTLNKLQQSPATRRRLGI